MKRWIFNLLDPIEGTNYWLNLFNKTKNYSLRQLQEWQNEMMIMRGFDWNGFTTKKEIRNFKPESTKGCTKHQTSGSTGEPLTVYGPKSLEYIKSAIFERQWRSLGWNGRDWIVRLTAGEPKWKRYDYWRNVKPHNYRKINDELIDWIIKNKPFLIHGVAGAIREIIDKLADRMQYSLIYDTKFVLMSEDVTNHKTQLRAKYDISENVYSGYGLAELCTVASECKYHQLHVNMETCMVQIINGEIAVTDLFNDVTPIVSYLTKDKGKLWVNSDCKCGLKSDILFEVVGRSIDYYNGSEVKKPIGWWLVSPISHRYGKIKKWKATINLTKKELHLYFIGNADLTWYRKFVKRKTGLTLIEHRKRKIDNMKLLEVIR